MGGVKGNQQKNVRPTAKSNGVIVDAQVVLLVDHVKESAWKMMDVVSLRLDTASVTVKKGSVLQLHVKEAMIQLQKCFGGESCGSCKRECQENEGCGRESTGQCKGYCQEKW